MEHPANHKTALIVALLVLAFAISVLVTAYEYRGGSGIFPRFIGWVFVGLTLIECIVQLKSLTSSGQGSLFAFSFTRPGEKVIKELKGILWIGFILITLYLGGFLAGIPVYVFAFLRLSAGRSYKQSLLLSAGATGFIYLLFIELLQYRLYQGLIFG
jgi:hypothetical protein